MAGSPNGSVCNRCSATSSGSAVSSATIALAGVPARTEIDGRQEVNFHQIAQVIVFNAAVFGLGITFFGALGLLWGADQVAPLLHSPLLLLRLGAGATLAALAGFVVLCGLRREIRLRGRWVLRLPTAGLALRQLVISALELTASALALWVLLPGERIPLATFMTFYAIAIGAGIASHVPGGVGVFEAVMLLVSGAHVPTEVA